MYKYLNVKSFVSFFVIFCFPSGCGFRAGGGFPDGGCGGNIGALVRSAPGPRGDSFKTTGKVSYAFVYTLLFEAYDSSHAQLPTPAPLLRFGVDAHDEPLRFPLDCRRCLRRLARQHAGVDATGGFFE